MPGPKSDKLWSQAIRMAAMREMEDPNTPGKKAKRLNIIADNLVRMAAEGDIMAMKEVGDRIDGKAIARNEHAGPDGESIPLALNVGFKSAD